MQWGPVGAEVATAQKEPVLQDGLHRGGKEAHVLTFARSAPGGHADGRGRHRGPKVVSRNRVFTATSAVKAVTTAR